MLSTSVIKCWLNYKGIVLAHALRLADLSVPQVTGRSLLRFCSVHGWVCYWLDTCSRAHMRMFAFMYVSGIYGMSEHHT